MNTVKNVKQKETKNEKFLSISATNTIDETKKYINEINSSNLTIDISKLNILDASKYAILCATQHFLKYPKGLLNLIVASEEVLNLIKPFGLNNVNIKY